jgi:hypothetical protein
LGHEDVDSHELDVAVGLSTQLIQGMGELIVQKYDKLVEVWKQ